MPREFLDTADDRYIFDEEGDVTEIYFIMNGEWAVAFDSFAKDDLEGMAMDQEQAAMKGKPDMSTRGILIALRKSNFGYIGDYYVLASKRAAFYYVALSRVSAYALTKQFIFKQLFKKFPGLHPEMLAESFSRYIKDFRKPCGKTRIDTIKKLNNKKQYSQINLDNLNDQKKQEARKLKEKEREKRERAKEGKNKEDAVAIESGV